MNPAVPIGIAAVLAVLASRTAQSREGTGMPSGLNMTALGPPIAVHAGERWRVTVWTNIPHDQREAMATSLRRSYEIAGNVRLLQGPLWQGDYATFLLEYTADTSIFRMRIELGGGYFLQMAGAVRVTDG